MEKSEMRAIRRQWINEWIQHNHRRYLKGWNLISLSDAKKMIRESEAVQFGFELQAYKMFP